MPHRLHTRRSSVHFISTYPASVPGSVTRYLWIEAALRLQRDLHPVSVSVPRENVGSADYEPLRQAGIHVHGYSTFPRGLVQRIKNYLSPIKHAVRHLEDHPADLYVLTNAGCLDGVEWGLALARMHRPFISISHCVRAREWPDDEQAALARTVYSSAVRTVFVSKSNREMLQLQLGIQLRSACVIPSNCLVGRDEQLPWPTADGPLKLACPARYQPQDKGQDLIIRALTDPRWKNRDLQVHCYGSGKAHHSLEQSASLLGVADKIFFCGPVTDIREIWKDHHALLLPSRSEGFPLTVMESMLLSRPVIVSDVADNASFIENGVNGFMMGVDSVTDLNAGLEHFWQNRQQLEQLGKNARRTILSVLPADPVGLLEAEIHGVLASGKAR